jgi:hypothetical protein
MNVAARSKIRTAARGLAGDFSALPKAQKTRIARVFGHETKVLGFKLLFRSSARWLIHPRFAPALWFDRFESFLGWFAARRDIRIIHIVRRDPVEWLKSKYVSDKLKAFAGKVYPDDVTVRVPIAEALKRLACKDWIDRRLASLADTNSYLRVAYEDFLKSDHAIVEQMMVFLDRDPAKLGSFDYRGHRKQSGRSARDYISNFDQLVETLWLNGALTSENAAAAAPGSPGR